MGVIEVRSRRLHGNRRPPASVRTGGALCALALSCSPFLGDVDVDGDITSTDGRSPVANGGFLPVIPAGSVVDSNDMTAADLESSGVCPERSFRCSGAQLDYCDGTTWIPWQLCGSAVLCESEPAGRCLAAACTIGQRRCNDTALEGCNVDGTGWLLLETCESAAYCDAISGCGVEPCLQGQSRCNDSLVEVCRSDGLGWDFVERCASADLCSNDAVSQSAVCVAAACAEGELRCAEDGTRSICNPQRTAFVSCASSDALCNGLGALCSPGDAPLGDPPLEAPPLDDVPPQAPSTPAGGAVDAPEAASCVFGPFAEPERLTNDPSGDYWSPAMSSDSLTVYFGGNRGDDAEHVFSTARANPGAPFVTAILTAGVNSNASEGTPLESFDGRTLYFYSTRPGGQGNRDLWSATRPDRSSDFARPAPLEVINGPGVDHLPWLSRDELTLVFSSIRPGGDGDGDLWVSRRQALEQDFSAPVLLDGVNSPAAEGRAALSSDQLGIIFSSARAGGSGGFDLWSATRGSVGEAFGDVENLGELNGTTAEIDPFLSEDGRELLFVSDRRGRAEIWRATRPCE